MAYGGVKLKNNKQRARKRHSQAGSDRCDSLGHCERKNALSFNNFLKKFTTYISIPP
jgi:hypothetical protein